MTSTTTGLPDRYRPLDQVGPDEPTPTGVIRCWRAKDRVLNRDVAIRVHTPAGPAAHAWITRALTAGGLATPALAMVYDASEGTGDPTTPGGAAYVVNEWIDGETLTERLARGPLPERDVRTVLRRLAEGVAEAHRVGLALGGITADNVVLRPNGLVGLRAVPAATGTVDDDIAALGSLLEACLTGMPMGEAPARPLTGSSDLLALVRRAKSAEPGQGLSSVAAMVALLKERARTNVAVSTQPQEAPEESEGGWRRRMRDRKAAAAAGPAGSGPGRAPETVVQDPPAVSAGPERMDPETMPPVPPVRPLGSTGPIPAGAVGGDTINASTVAPVAGAYAASVPPPPATSTGPVDRPVPPPGERPVDSTYDDVYADDSYDEPFGVLSDRELDEYQRGPYTDAGPVTEETDTSPRRRLLVIGLPLLALAVVIGLALWIGNTLLSVTGSVDDNVGSTPSGGGASSSAPAEESEETAAAGGPIQPVAAEVFDPFGDGEPENDGDVPQSFDGDPATSWSTLNYRGSAAFGNLKPGVGVLYDLGSEQQLAGVTVTTTTSGTTVEIRTGDAADGQLDSYATAGSGSVEGTAEFTFDEPATARYVLVWVTGLVEGGEGFSADLAEVSILSAS